VDSVTFPALFGGGGGADDDSPYVKNYSISLNSTFSGTFTLDTTDNVDNLAMDVAPFTILLDENAPALSGQTLSVSEGAARVYLVPPTRLYYAASGTNDTLTIEVTAEEPQINIPGDPGNPYPGSGVQRVTFPPLFNTGEQMDYSAPYEVTYPIAGGPLTPSDSFELQTRDNVDNDASGATFEVLRDPTAPTLSGQTLSLGPNPSGVYLASPTLLYFGPLASGTLNIGVTASDQTLSGGYAGSGVQRVTFPTLFGATPSDTTAPYQGVYTLGGGYSHNGFFNTTATDNVGNQATGAPVEIIKDETGPLTVTVSVPTPYAPLNVPVSWSAATDGQSGVAGYEAQYSVDGGANWNPNAWYSGEATQATFVAGGPGAYSFRVRAIDQVGNAGAWSDPVTTTVDNAPPTVQMGLSPQSGLLINVSWQGWDGSGVDLMMFNTGMEQPGRPG
jgi:hypothetical protein